jgi:hypothetical protein
MKKTILILSIFFILFTGCKKDELTGDEKSLVGTWTSISTIITCGTIPGLPMNPNLKLVFLEEGKYKLFSSDNKIESGRLIKINGLVTFETSSRNSKLNGRSVEKFNSDTVCIDLNGCGDDYIFRFVKN